MHLRLNENNTIKRRFIVLFACQCQANFVDMLRYLISQAYQRKFTNKKKALVGLLIVLSGVTRSFCPQRKKSSVKPHGRHVANKRGRPTLFDTHGVNQTLPNVAPVVVVSMKGSSQEEARMTSVHYPGEKIVDDKKRKRKRKKHHMKKLMKKMQDDMKSFSRVGVSNYA